MSSHHESQQSLEQEIQTNWKFQCFNDLASYYIDHIETAILDSGQDCTVASLGKEIIILTTLEAGYLNSLMIPAQVLLLDFQGSIFNSVIDCVTFNNKLWLLNILNNYYEVNDIVFLWGLMSWYLKSVLKRAWNTVSFLYMFVIFEFTVI